MAYTIDADKHTGPNNVEIEKERGPLLERAQMVFPADTDVVLSTNNLLDPSFSIADEYRIHPQSKWASAMEENALIHDSEYIPPILLNHRAQ